MSNYHATADVSDALAPALPTPGAVFAVLARPVRTAFGGLRAAIEQRLALQRISRMSDHMLADFGFERDWDGTIRSRRDAGGDTH